MVVENELPAFADWIAYGVPIWLQALLGFGLTALVFAAVTATIRNGPVRAFAIVANGLREFVIDFARISPRRVLGLAILAVKESIHRLVLVAFGVFILILLFAGWYLDAGSRNPAELYLSFVLTVTSYLVLMLALFLSVFSLPTDIANRTIYTVVTKPVRASEIVLGRFLGFACIGSVLLFVTGLISYVFVVRGIAHSHDVAADAVQPVENLSETDEVVARGRSGRDREDKHGHRHDILVYRDGTAEATYQNGHTHDVEVVGEGDARTFTIGNSPRGVLTARVPIYGQLAFIDREGQPGPGTDVGKEWKYRRYIEGASLASGIWQFSNVYPADFPDGLPIELSIRVFRTHKGEIDKGILGSLKLRNPVTRRESRALNFTAREYYIDSHFFPRALTDREGNEIDLFDDLVANDGTLEIELKCAEPGMFFGVAKADLYLRARDGSFTSNFVKGYLGIWLQMLIVLGLGVMFSTFLNGAVAMLATMGSVIAGWFTPFLIKIARNENLGGGPLESLVRMANQDNLMADLEPGAGTSVVLAVDLIVRPVLGVLATALPALSWFDGADYVAAGFDVPAGRLGIQICMTLGYLVPILVAGYFLLKSREIAK